MLIIAKVVIFLHICTPSLSLFCSRDEGKSKSNSPALGFFDRERGSF